MVIHDTLYKNWTVTLYCTKWVFYQGYPAYRINFLEFTLTVVHIMAYSWLGCTTSFRLIIVQYGYWHDVTVTVHTCIYFVSATVCSCMHICWIIIALHVCMVVHAWIRAETIGEMSMLLVPAIASNNKISMSHIGCVCIGPQCMHVNTSIGILCAIVVQSNYGSTMLYFARQAMLTNNTRLTISRDTRYTCTSLLS